MEPADSEVVVSNSGFIKTQGTLEEKIKILQELLITKTTYLILIFSFKKDSSATLPVLISLTTKLLSSTKELKIERTCHSHYYSLTGSGKWALYTLQ